MSLRLLILQNSEVEGPGYLLEWAAGVGLLTALCQPFLGEKIPSAATFSHLIILGSPHSVSEMDSLPWLQQEASWVRAALSGNLRILGICLGSQLLAHLLGGLVLKGPHAEIGWHPLEWLESAHSFGLSGAGFPLFQWHQEIFTLPPGAKAIARSPATALLAFIWEERVWAIGGHPEMNEKLVTDYSLKFWQKAQGTYVQQPEEMLAGIATNLAESRKGVSAFLNAWAAL